VYDTISRSVDNRRELHFEWDEAKALSNFRKHGVAFQMATSVFRDPFMVSTFDEEHSTVEERWVSLGMGFHGITLVVVYVWTEVDATNVNVRIISARKANAEEQREYEGSR
jgi:uncharacterized DUF497 family protein